MSPVRQLLDLLLSAVVASVGGLLVSLTFYYVLHRLRQTIERTQRSRYFLTTYALVILTACVFVFTLEQSANVPELITTLLLWLIFLIAALVGYKIAEAYFLSVRNQVVAEFEALSASDEESLNATNTESEDQASQDTL